MSVGGEGAVPSAARVLSDREARDLIAMARALPASWVVVLTPPHGQVVMLPRRFVHADHRCYVADGELGVLYRINSRQGVRIPAVPARPLAAVD